MPRAAAGSPPDLAAPDGNAPVPRAVTGWGGALARAPDGDGWATRPGEPPGLLGPAAE